MLFAIIGAILVIITIIVIVAVIKGKKECTCLGKKCLDTDGCGNICCDEKKNQKCVNGYCCLADCSGKSCDQKNDCGEACTSYVCNPDEKCFQGNCCKPQCDGKSCQNDGCGGTCPCPKGKVCFQGNCCTPPNCDNFCGTACGMTCNCNDRYCYPNSCCSGGTCQYSDICNSPVGITLKGQWAKFCDVCEMCSLKNAKFKNDSAVPISGELECTHCDGKNVEPVQIDDMAFYYEYNKDNANPAIVPRYNSVQQCSSVVCSNDSDCQRFNCKTCLAGQCT